MTGTALYCRRCWCFLRMSDEGHEPITWVAACDRCRERMAQARVERKRQRELWKPRQCAAPECTEVFSPARAGQRFCSDRCRKRTHARRKAEVARLNGA
jgi:hypothetical protein